MGHPDPGEGLSEVEEWRGTQETSGRSHRHSRAPELAINWWVDHGNDQVRFFSSFLLSLLMSPFLQLIWSFEALGDTEDPDQLFVEGL